MEVITIGSAAVDVFGTIGCKIKECKLGDKVLVEELNFDVGGGGVNSAIALSRMGIKVGFLGKLGHDHNAFKVLHELQKEKVKVIKTGISEEKTAWSYVLKSKKENDRIIFVHKGASDHLDYSDFPKKVLKVKWVYMATMLEKSFETCEKIAGYCLKNNVNLMFNPSTYLAEEGARHLKNILKATTCLVLNKSEAKLMLKTDNDNCKEIIELITTLGPKMVVITEGPKGATAFDGSKFYKLNAYKVRVLNTAGAGDAFASGFLAGLLHKMSTKHALEMGMANSASVVQYYGTRNKLLTHRQAHKFIRSRREKVKII